MTEKLCDMLHKHDESTPCCSDHTENTEETVDKTETKLSRESLHNPKIQPGGVYNAKGKIFINIENQQHTYKSI